MTRFKRTHRHSVSILFFILAALSYYFFVYVPEQDALPVHEEAEQAAGQAVQPVESITICSFNIQFLGQFTRRRNEDLAFLMKPYDIVVIQELVAPPEDGVYPDGSSYTADDEANVFFDAMEEQGFRYVLSEEDTGTGEGIHQKGPATEWWVAFYHNQVRPAPDLPSGFLAADRSDHPDYERVPYAFGFRTVDSALDFVLISVHLMPGSRTADMERRRHELAAISAWIDDHDDIEKDFIILGDMNIESPDELQDVTPAGFISLNDECRQTNTNQRAGSGKPYDHVMYRPDNTGHEIDAHFDLEVLDLIGNMKSRWDIPEPFPGEPYLHNDFRQLFSDHHPVIFRMIPSSDDD